MISEDATVAVSLSDDEQDTSKTLNQSFEVNASPLLENDEETPSKLTLNLSNDDTPASSPPATIMNTSAEIKPSMEIQPASSSGFRTQSPVYTSFSHDTDYLMTVSVKNYEKRGDGMGAYVVYNIIATCEGVTGYKNATYDVWRRFSDFLGLRDKLVEKHQPKGIIVPAAPEKSITAMTKTKTSTEPSFSTEVAIRARQLERFLRRVIQHPRMRTDCDVRDFLTSEMDLPHATQTAALSSAGVKRIFKSVGEVFSKMAFHMEEGDRWFEQTQSHIDELEESLKRLLSLATNLANTRKELAFSQESLSKGLAMLASCENSTSLARALAHLTETEDSAATIWAKQAESDTVLFSEAINEYVGLIASLKDVFSERVRVWQNWQNTQQTLQKKREIKARMELSGKTERLNQVKDEIEDTARRMDQLEAEFLELSKLIREEVQRFDVQRRQDMKKIVIDYLESLVKTHTDLMKLWEKFEPETASIIV